MVRLQQFAPDNMSITRGKGTGHVSSVDVDIGDAPWSVNEYWLKCGNLLLWFIISSTPTGFDTSFPRLILNTQLGKPSLQFLQRDGPTLCDIDSLEAETPRAEWLYQRPGLHFQFDGFLHSSLITSRRVFIFRPQESLIPFLQLRAGPSSGFHLDRGATCWCGHDWKWQPGSRASPLIWEKWLVYTRAGQLVNNFLRFSSVKHKYNRETSRIQTRLFHFASNSHDDRGVGSFSYWPRDWSAQNLQSSAT